MLNEESLRVFSWCKNCNATIYEDDYYYNLNGEFWCEDCVEECRRQAEMERYDEYN